MTLDFKTYERIYNLATNKARKLKRDKHKSIDKTFNIIFNRMVNAEIERRRVKC